MDFSAFAVSPCLSETTASHFVRSHHVVLHYQVWAYAEVLSPAVSL